MVRFGVGLTGDMPALKTAEIARTAEESGFEYVWVADENPSPPYRDVFVTMTAIALRTERIKIGTGICNPYSRHPAQLAVAIYSLNEMARGRVILGLGPGGSLCLRPLGIKLWEKPISATIETFKISRGLFAGETVNLKGKVFTTVNCKLDPPPKERIPIYLAARGPKMLELVGELSDGTLLTSPLGYLDFVLDRIKAGAEKTRRKLANIDIANWLPFAITGNSEKAREMVKFDVCFMVADSPDLVHEKIGLKHEDVDAVRKALRIGVPEAAEKVTSEMVDNFAIAGTQEECERKIEKFIDAGVTQVSLALPFGVSPKDVIKQVGETIIPKFLDD